MTIIASCGHILPENEEGILAEWDSEYLDTEGYHDCIEIGILCKSCFISNVYENVREYNGS